MYIQFYNSKTQTLTLSNKPCTFKGNPLSLLKSSVKFINTMPSTVKFQLKYLGWY